MWATKQIFSFELNSGKAEISAWYSATLSIIIIKGVTIDRFHMIWMWQLDRKQYNKAWLNKQYYLNAEIDGHNSSMAKIMVKKFRSTYFQQPLFIVFSLILCICKLRTKKRVRQLDNWTRSECQFDNFVNCKNYHICSSENPQIHSAHARIIG